MKQEWDVDGLAAASVGQLVDATGTINAANGWERCTREEYTAMLCGEIGAVRKVCTLLALVHTEVAEATEAVRARNEPNFEEELADIVIRVFDLAGGLGIALDHAIAEKLVKNSARGWRHGGKAV